MRLVLSKACCVTWELCPLSRLLSSTAFFPFFRFFLPRPKLHCHSHLPAIDYNMKIFVKGMQTFTVEVEPDDTIAGVKGKL